MGDVDEIGESERSGIPHRSLQRGAGARESGCALTAVGFPKPAAGSAYLGRFPRRGSATIAPPQASCVR